MTRIRQGSPPLTRGPRSLSRPLRSNLRITPAHAGTTSAFYFPPFPPSDHPRSRGDHLMAPAAGSIATGSPPLTRGPLANPPSASVGEGITPAHAGTTAVIVGGVSDLEDHPRSRGDHCDEYSPIGRPFGSPPLTRGPRRSPARGYDKIRITPAHAGTTKGLLPVLKSSRDHPRSRGDHIQRIAINCGIIGSPPLTRGPRPLDDPGPRTVGITPAHAGTTLSVKWSTAVVEDHPRSRGDHSRMEPPSLPTRGSPPLTRGPQWYLWHRGKCIGITPAHAGTT